MTENDLITQEGSDQASAARTDVVPVEMPSAPEPRRPIARFVKEHPVLTIAGGLAAGALVAALAPRRNRAVVRRKAVDWADIVSNAAVTLAQQALDRAESAGDTVRRKAEAAGERAGALGHSALHRAERLGHQAADLAAKATPFQPRKPATLAERLSNEADRLKKK